MPSTEPDDRSLRDVLQAGGELFNRLSPEGGQPPWVTLADVAPALGTQVGYALGAVVNRPGLDLRTREIATVCMLAAIGGADAQLAFHAGAALRAGATTQELVEALTQVSVYAGIPRALNAVAAVRAVLAEAGARPVGGDHGD